MDKGWRTGQLSAPGSFQPAGSRPSTASPARPVRRLAADPAAEIDDNTDNEEEWDDQGVADDRLRLIFTCCHPALSPERVALTLREVCGLTTEEIARLSDCSTHLGTAHRARQGQDSRRRDSVSGAGAG